MQKEEMATTAEAEPLKSESHFPNRKCATRVKSSYKQTHIHKQHNAQRLETSVECQECVGTENMKVTANAHAHTKPTTLPLFSKINKYHFISN